MRAAIKVCDQDGEGCEISVQGGETCLDGGGGVRAFGGWRLLREGLECGVGTPILSMKKGIMP